MTTPCNRPLAPCPSVSRLPLPPSPRLCSPFLLPLTLNLLPHASSSFSRSPLRLTLPLPPLSPHGFSFGGDWWGLGIISFELITGRFPWKNIGT